MTATITTLKADETSTDTILTRDSYKGHGQPQAFYFWGTGKLADEQLGTLVTSVEANGLTLVLKADGKTVAQFDKRGKFWISPAFKHEELRHYSDGDSIATWYESVPQAPKTDPAPAPTADAKAIVAAATPVKARRPGRNAKLSPCLCGCKAQVKGMYKQGHDARHAGDVARKAIKAAAGADPDVNLLTAIEDVLAELPTQALRVKAANIVTKVLS
jgi:hypothetical protein